MSEYEDIKIKAQMTGMFETPVVMAKFEQSDQLIDDLKRIILNQMETDPGGMKRSNVGGWHSDTEMLTWGGLPARILAEKAIAMAKRMSAFSGTTHEAFDWWCQMWANVSGPGAANHIHVHPGNLWSAVLYIDMGGGGETGDDVSSSEGRFYFEDPRFPMAYMHNSKFRFVSTDGQGAAVQPEIRTQRGDFLMFPAWLRHGVRPYLGNRQRISIALNVDAIPI